MARPDSPLTPIRHGSPPAARAIRTSTRLEGIASAGADLEPLLRGRLIIVALLAALTSAFFSAFRAQSPEQWAYFRASPSGTGLLLLEAGICTAGLLLAVLLWRLGGWTLPRLRAVEYLLLGFFALYIAWAQLFAWGAARFALDASTPVEPFVLRQAVDSMAGRWVTLIVGISTLIPETWRRNAAIVAALATVAMGVTLYMGLTDEGYRPHLGAMLALMGFWMAVASTIAVFGSYKLAELRQQVHEARRLGPYRLIRLLGRGGMGEVHLAEHRMLKQPCAIKLIRPELAADRATLQRFEREVQAISRLKHWNTVQIYDYGYADDGTFYYVMEYLPGLTLDEMVRRHGPLPAARAVHLLRQVCAALREAHAIELVHRDVKPANIIVGERGGVPDVAKLLDFGIVRSLGLGETIEKLTLDGRLLGTPAYMSPEQILGEAAVDGRSDIYSVGAVGYLLVTGQPPFVRDSAIQVLSAHVTDPVVPPRALRPDVPADLDAVLVRCLAKAPQDRFPDVRRLDEALAACASAAPWSEAEARAWWRTHGASEPEPMGAMPG